MNKIGIPMAKEPLPDLLRFYDKLGREHHDWITRTDKYIYHVSYIAEKCKYEVLRALEVEAAYEQVDGVSMLRKSSRLMLDTIESFRNGQWVSVMCKPAQQDDEPDEMDEVDDDAYMKVIGYA